jgi:hypothetical protein
MGIGEGKLVMEVRDMEEEVDAAVDEIVAGVAEIGVGEKVYIQE